MHLSSMYKNVLIKLFPVGAVKAINIFIINLPVWKQAVHTTWYIAFHDYMRAYKAKQKN